MPKSKDLRVELMLDGGDDPITPGSNVSFTVYINTKKTIKVTCALSVAYQHQGYWWQREDRASVFMTSSVDLGFYDVNNQRHPYSRTSAPVTVDLTDIQEHSSGSPPVQQGMLKSDNVPMFDTPLYVDRLQTGVFTKMAVTVRRMSQRPTLVPYLDKSSSQFSSRGQLPLPPELPDTWQMDHKEVYAEVTNYLTATLKYHPYSQAVEKPEQEAVAKTLLNVKNRLVVEDLPGLQHEPVCQRKEKSIRRLFREPGRIECSLTVRDQLGLLGHDLPLIVRIDNKSHSTINGFSLTLFKEYTFTQLSGKILEEIFRAPMPDVKHGECWHKQIDGFKIPNNCLTSRSLQLCQFVNVRFFVRLRVGWLLGSMTNDVTVYLGTEARQPPDLPEIDLDRHEILV